MTTRWSKRGQAVKQPRPYLTKKSSSGQPRQPGHPVPPRARGTTYAPRNPMHDSSPHEQEDHRDDPIKTSLLLKGVR